MLRDHKQAGPAGGFLRGTPKYHPFEKDFPFEPSILGYPHGHGNPQLRLWLLPMGRSRTIIQEPQHGGEASASSF